MEENLIQPRSPRRCPFWHRSASGLRSKRRRQEREQELSAIPPWLDGETGALVKDKVNLLVERHPDVLEVVLYGSVARHEERPLDDPETSDVDLLALLDTDDPHAVLSQLRA